MRRPLCHVSIILLLHYSNATFYAAESGPQLLKYNGNDDGRIVDVVEELAQVDQLDGKGVYNDYEGSENDGMYDIGGSQVFKEEDSISKADDNKPVITRKKGQSEYVEFIEPKVSDQLNNREMLEERIVSDQVAAAAVQRSNLKPVLHTGNFLFLAVAIVCMIGMGAGIASGSYYFYKVRSQKTAASADSCDFTYAPAGPGKNKKKKGGDEALAYKAQLHHYQQAKQKIISGEDGMVTLPDADETSETSDDENNFSVYECPGLAPTGDIEVQNPNFISRP